tara:strand:- start:784 stop:3384 length:2601 start_codon:yes stop_codon:yes gene_type:complete
VSILEDYRRLQEEQRAKGIDPSVAPRLTQEEQDILRQEIAATSVDTTTASSQPSTDVSGTGMLTESTTQTQARESVTDDTMSYEDRYNNLKTELTNQMDALKLNDFTYVNPGDLDYIIDEQAKEFAKAGVDSILDIGKRTEKVSSRDVEVEKTTDPNGNVIYQYTTGGMVGFGGGDPKTITVDPSTVKEVMRGMSGQGVNVQPVYIATLPNKEEQLYNKKTGENIDVFQGKGTLEYGGVPEERTVFGSLYSNVEGGANLNVEFMEDGTPVFYPLYKDTSDKGLINAAVMLGSLAVPVFGSFGAIGNTLSAGKFASTSAAANAIGAATVAGTGSFITSEGDLKSAAIGALLAGATTYGVQSGFVGDQLVNLGVSEKFLAGENPLGITIPTSNSSIPQAFSNELAQGDYIVETGADGYRQVFSPVRDANGVITSKIPESALTDKLNNLLVNYPDAKVTTFGVDNLGNTTITETKYSPDILGGGGGTVGAGIGGTVTTTEYGINPATGGMEQVSSYSSPFDASPAANIVRSQEALNQAVSDGIISEADANIASTELSKSGGVFDDLSEGVKDIVTKVGGGLAATGIDLKSIFGEGIGGTLQKLLGAGIDYAGLSALQSSLEERGEEIQKEYEGVFTPYTVTTGFGTAEIGTAGATATVGYDYDPIRSAQITSALGMFEDLPTTRADATAAQLAATQAITEPQRLREQERLLGTLRQRGLLGYGQTMPTVDGQRRVSPLAESLYSAQELARSQEALAAQQFGLTEAQRQANLGAGLLTGAQKIDEAAMAGLTTGRDISATLQQKPELAGLGARSQYDQLVALAEIEKLRGLQSGARGLFGLPTQQGNVDVNQLQQLINLANLIAPKTATG